MTPFSPRALDRALAATTVALARHGHKPMTRPGGADAIVTEAGVLVESTTLAARMVEFLEGLIRERRVRSAWPGAAVGA